MATTTRPEYLRSQFQATVDLGDSFSVDYGDPRLHRLVRSISRGFYVTWDQSDRLPTVSYRYYGNVSLWWLIGLYNGITHPLEIEPGTQVFIPDGGQVDDFIRRVRQSLIPAGSVTII